MDEITPFGGEYKLTFLNTDAGSREFNSLGDAISYGRSSYFEFLVTKGDQILASWTLSGGLKYHESQGVDISVRMGYNTPIN